MAKDTQAYLGMPGVLNVLEMVWNSCKGGV
jgi:hypothetical protein